MKNVKNQNNNVATFFIAIAVSAGLLFSGSTNAGQVKIKANYKDLISCEAEAQSENSSEPVVGHLLAAEFDGEQLNDNGNVEYQGGPFYWVKFGDGTQINVNSNPICRIYMIDGGPEQALTRQHIKDGDTYCIDKQEGDGIVQLWRYYNDIKEVITINPNEKSVTKEVIKVRAMNAYWGLFNSTISTKKFTCKK